MDDSTATENKFFLFVKNNAALLVFGAFPFVTAFFLILYYLITLPTIEQTSSLIPDSTTTYTNPFISVTSTYVNPLEVTPTTYENPFTNI
jgi:hypothetical protein